MRGQALRRAGPVEVSVKHSAWATAALAVSATLVIAACGSSHSSASSGTSSSTSSSATSSASTSAKFLGCVVLDTGGVNDRSFNAAAWAGMQAAAAANSNIKVTYLQSTTPADYTPNINTFIGQKC